jgi:hypothetical protein
MDDLAPSLYSKRCLSRRMVSLRAPGLGGPPKAAVSLRHASGWTAAGGLTRSSGSRPGLKADLGSGQGRRVGTELDIPWTRALANQGAGPWGSEGIGRAG